MILKKKKAKKIRETCNNLYEHSIAEVYEYCNGINLSYSKCDGCNAETPSIKTVDNCECAICGGNKDYEGDI